jgi:hypothetical protein
MRALEPDGAAHTRYGVRKGADNRLMATGLHAFARPAWAAGRAETPGHVRKANSAGKARLLGSVEHVGVHHAFLKLAPST